MDDKECDVENHATKNPLTHSAPCVSVLMPSLNTARYIREALDSVVNQTLKDIEIICIDAGSTDGTREIIGEYAERDSRIRVIDSPVKSYGYQMNVGLDAARGEYLAIAESDDYVDADMMKQLYDTAVDNNLDFVKSDLIKFTRESDIQHNKIFPLSSEREIYGRLMNPSENPALLNLLMNTYTGIYSLRFLRENGTRHNETPGASFQDNGFWFRTFVVAKRAMFVNKAFYYLRRDNPNSSIYSKGKVYCANEEYADISRWLYRRERKICERFLPSLIYHKFRAYDFSLWRIADEYKFEYAMCMFGVFKDADCAGLIDRSLFDEKMKSKLDALLSDPIEFAFGSLSRAGRVRLCSTFRRHMSVGKRFLHENPLVRMVQCYRDNGFFYTLRRIFFGKQNGRKG
jgi:glycosyltransferase involved in cell wall biosynthesis